MFLVFSSLIIKPNELAYIYVSDGDVCHSPYKPYKIVSAAFKHLQVILQSFLELVIKLKVFSLILLWGVKINEDIVIIDVDFLNILFFFLADCDRNFLILSIVYFIMLCLMFKSLMQGLTFYSTIVLSELTRILVLINLVVDQTVARTHVRRMFMLKDAFDSIQRLVCYKTIKES